MGSRHRWYLAVLACAAGLVFAGSSRADDDDDDDALLLRQAVGGIFVDNDGALRNAEIDQTNRVRRLRSQGMKAIAVDLNRPTELRKISLRRLEDSVAQHLKEGKSLPEEMRYLAGLQSIRYVLVYPEQHDIVLVGYGEGWVLDKRGFVVGRTTDKSVLQLDDLVVALRWAMHAEESGPISCSIDPSASGLQKLQDYTKSLTNISQISLEQLEQTLGPQTVKVDGVAADTHMARVLVAADYRMKRIAMKLDPSPVPGLSGYPDLIKLSQTELQTVTPRWWLAPRYSQSLLSDPSGLAWEYRGSTVEALTEEMLFASEGGRPSTSRAGVEAQQWANKMTEKYEALAAKEPIFGLLHNCIDLATVAALIVKQEMPESAGLALSVLTDPGQYTCESYESARTIQSQCGISRKGTNFVITASGGVEIQPAPLLDRVERTTSLNALLRSSGPPDGNAWWWN